METLYRMQMLQLAQNMNQPQNAGVHAHPMANALPPIKSYGNPLQEGANSGIQAAKHSIQGDENDQRRAMGQAIMHLVTNLNANRDYGQGLTGFANALNKSVIPTANAYNSEMDRAKAENYQLLQREDKLQQKEDERNFRMMQHAEQQAYRQEQLNEVKRYHNMTLQQQSEKAQMQYGEVGLINVSNVEKLKEEGKIPQSAIPLATLPKNVQTLYHKDMMDKANKGKSYNGVITSLYEMRKLSKDFPNLDTDFNQILLDPDNADQHSIMALSKLKGSNPKARAAIEKWRKLTSKLVENKVMGVSGQKGTDMMKKIISEGVPRYGQTKEAREFVIESQLNDYIPLLEQSKWASKGISDGFYVPSSSNYEIDEQTHNNNEQEISIEDRINNASPEELMQIRKELGLDNE